MPKQSPLTLVPADRTMPAIDVTPPTPGALAGLITVLAAIVARECATAPPEQKKEAA